MEKLPDGDYKSPRKLNFQVTYEMVPSFRLLVFAHHNNQLLVDSLKIDVEKVCDPDAKVSIEPQFSFNEPGNTGKIVVRGKARAYVGILGVDEAVYALSKKDLLTKKKIFKSLNTHDLGCGPGGGLTTNDILGKAGIILGSDLFSQNPDYSCGERKRRKRNVEQEIDDMYRQQINNYTEFQRACCDLGKERDILNRTCEERKRIVEHFLKKENINCLVAFMNCCNPKLKPREPEIPEEFHLMGGNTIPEEFFDLVSDPEFRDTFEREAVARSNFKETWIYEDFEIGIDGKKEIQVSLPHSITTWVIQAVSVSPTHGICVADPQRIESFQKVFLDLNMPYSVVRNEQIEIQATLFNYGDRRLQGVMYMDGEDRLCCGTKSGERSKRQAISVDGQSTVTITFPVIPLKAEIIPFKVVAFTSAGFDVIVKELNVVPEGITEEIDVFVKLDPTNLQRRKKRNIESLLYTDKLDQNLQITSIELRLPENYVPGTESCTIRAVGDMLGPAVQTVVQNPESLLIKPHGCGEQNMMRLAPTLYTMRYLKVTGKLSPEAEGKGYKYMRSGYATQLKYRRDDGSYSATAGYQSNKWLTAFVTKVFCQATELIYIDQKVIFSGISWLINSQEEDGSYLDYHPMWEPKLMGGLEGAVPLTAFVLIAFQECNCEEHVQALNRAKMRAIRYLENNLEKTNSPLAAAIVAYALSLKSSERMSDANDRLLSMAMYEEGPNWLYWTTDNSAHDIQTSAYALLTQLLFNDMDRSTSIVNWLNTKQLQSGFYESTQDTVIALQAMSEYAIKASVPKVNLVANITSRNDNFYETLAFNDQNALVLQDVKIKRNVGGSLLINTSGQGVGSLIVTVRYNVIRPPEDICKFDVSVNVIDIPHDDIINAIKEGLNQDPGTTQRATVPKKEDNKLKYKISLCVRYLGTSDTGMGIVDVGMFSGFAPVEEDLKEIESSYPSIQQIDRTNKGIVFYFEKFSNKGSYCFSFRVKQEYKVGSTKMSYIKVYDYYNSDATCTKSYKPPSNSPIIRTLCDGGICQCAEGGCPPKEPFSDIKDEPTDQRREKMLNLFCKEYDYVWSGKLDGPIQTEGGFFNISFKIDEVIKEGKERNDSIVNEMRTLIARDNCKTAELLSDVTYLILGKDGQGYMNKEGKTWYRYMLDQTSIVHEWASSSQDLELQQDISHVTRKIKNEGCAH